jgi:hypothetical protein
VKEKFSSSDNSIYIFKQLGEARHWQDEDWTCRNLDPNIVCRLIFWSLVFFLCVTTGFCYLPWVDGGGVLCLSEANIISTKASSCYSNYQVSFLVRVQFVGVFVFFSLFESDFLEV